MGSLFPDTSPFSAVTRSRYWMAGLVASGTVLTLYTLVSWLLGRLMAHYGPPAWWRMWALCAAPLLIGIPLITMTVNQPTLPLWNALQVTLVTLAGLALGLMPGKIAATRPTNCLLLAFDGGALMLVLLLAPGFEDVSRWLASGTTWRLHSMLLGFGAAALLLLISTGLRLWRRKPMPSAASVIAAGLSAAYVLMPLVHHLGFTDGHYYISSASNFFARNGAFQILTWLIAAAIALEITRLREHLETRWGTSRSGPG